MRKYIIIEISKLEDIKLNSILEDNKDTLRYNNDNTKFIVKYTKDNLEGFEGYTIYSLKDILKIINDPAEGWIKTKENDYIT
jgi:hypothetical protein